MSLSDLAAIGSLLSGTAVVITLAFLLMQMRQTNRNQRSLVQQGRSARRIGLHMRRAEPYLSDVMLRAGQGDTTLKASEILSVSIMVQATFEGYEDTFLQHRVGTIDRASWETEVASIRNYFSNPVTRIIWRRFRHGFALEFRDFADTLLKETKPVRLGDIAAAFNAGMAAELESI